MISCAHVGRAVKGCVEGGRGRARHTCLFDVDPHVADLAGLARLVRREGLLPVEGERGDKQVVPVILPLK